jgi:predicted nucleotidyltransferase component of viral defense system
MLITKPQLQAINKKTLKYPLDIAEKDYFLTLAVQLLADSPLRQVLVFKGGTALHHCYLPQYRFSEDLDFTALDHTLTLESVTAALVKGSVITIKRQSTFPATLKIERLGYAGVLAQPGALKVEIDRQQNVVLPPVETTYTNVWHVPVTVMTMDIREICAEKIRAASTRARYRDFYDLYLILERFALDREEIIGLLRQKEIRAPVSPAAMLLNWQRAKTEAANDLRSIYCTYPVDDQAIQTLLEQLTFDPITP